MPTCISAIVLAAGQSKRMGKSKQLLHMGSRTMLEHTLDIYLTSSACEVIVVLGDRSEEMIKIIDKRPVKIVVNERYEQGMSTSMIKGLDAVDKSATAVLFALVDQIFIDRVTIDMLINAFINSNKGIVVPVFKRTRGNPVIFDAKYKGELRILGGDKGGKEIIVRHSDDVLEVEVDCRGVIEDIDTIEEYRKACDRYDNLHLP